jgi:RNA polymerase sigma-70 factor (ECF subfamily)
VRAIQMKSSQGISEPSAEFERVVLVHLNDAYTLARYLVRDEHDAQDLVQDAALRALRHFGSFRDGDARSWFLAIVRNCCYTWVESRHGRARPGDDGDLLALVPDPRGADDRAIRSSERARVETALARLPVELREVIVLREVADLSYKEISNVVGVPAGTVMSRLSRARDRLATLLGSRDEAGA